MSELMLAEKLRMALLSERMEQIGMHRYSSEEMSWWTRRRTRPGAAIAASAEVSNVGN
jgi:hypothetical protein